MTLRQICEMAEKLPESLKKDFLDADIIVHTKLGVFDAEGAQYISNYLAMTPRGRISFNNVIILDFSKKAKEGIDRN